MTRAVILALGVAMMGCARRPFVVRYEAWDISLIKNIDDSEVAALCAGIKETDDGDPWPDGEIPGGCWDPNTRTIVLSDRADVCTVIHEFLHADGSLGKKRVKAMTEKCRDQ
jgi:hypothetical protein